MKLYLQLNEGICNPTGGWYTQVLMDANVDDDNVVCNTAFGVLVFSRSKIDYALILADDADLSALSDQLGESVWLIN